MEPFMIDYLDFRVTRPIWRYHSSVQSFARQGKRHVRRPVIKKPAGKKVKVQPFHCTSLMVETGHVEKEQHFLDWRVALGFTRCIRLLTLRCKLFFLSQVLKKQAGKLAVKAQP